MPRSKPRTAPPAKLDLSPSSVTLRAQDHEPKRVTVRAHDNDPNGYHSFNYLLSNFHRKFQQTLSQKKKRTCGALDSVAHQVVCFSL